MCGNCKYLVPILAAIILVFSFWMVAPYNWLTSQWIIIVAAIILLFHHFGCPCCHDNGTCKTDMKFPVKKLAVKRKKRK